MPLALSFRYGISTLYEYKSLEIGQEILGITLSPDVCLIHAGSICIPHPAALGNIPWLIKMVGTSGGSGQSDTDSGTEPEPETRPDSGTDEDEGTTSHGDNAPCSDNADVLASSYIIANEGWKNSCYRDTKGNLTIGVGHKITARDSISCGLPISDDQVQSLYEKDYAKYKAQAQASAARHGVDWDSLSPERQAVLTDMAYNMGAQGGEGLDGFDRMWAAIDQAQAAGNSPMAQTYWNMAGDEVTDTTTGYGEGSRAQRNAHVMRTNDRSALNRRINSDQHARNNCR